ncbi:MAG: hypothetical protein C0408_06450 [Odoribacter sp.]|nr:hypothetical protein [Odoribacter sp.]
MKFRIRMKKSIIAILIITLSALSALAQKKQQETVMKREVTLYNPFKPSLPDVIKKSYLPDMTDTANVSPVFKYDLRPEPFMPSYTISPIKPASILPDPLLKLYKSYINFGLGNYVTPLAEISITNERSKKGAIGIFARHFSTNGKVELQNLKKAFAGYMDNDVSFFGKKYLKKSIFNGSVDLSQKTRYAYGYDTIFKGYEPAKKDIRLNYYNAGAAIGLASAKLDSSSLSYDFGIAYNFFHDTKTLYQQNLGFTGLMAKSYKGFYVGSGIEFDYFSFSDSAYADPRYIAAINPFIKKNSEEWSVRLGFQALLDRGVTDKAKLHIYPDLNFSFNIVPSYISFFATMSGRLAKNEPFRVIEANPFIFPEKTLFNVPNTDYALVVKAGLTGSTGIEGNYQVSASYSVVNDMLFFANQILTNGTDTLRRGNYFKPLTDDVEVLNVHGEMGGKITGFLSFDAKANYYRYTLTRNEFAWNKPDWDASVGLKYNLKDKIIAGMDVNVLGKRKLLVAAEDINVSGFTGKTIEMPAHFNINLGAEYRYTKILSFWMKFNNIGFNRYYEWAYYPSQRFMCLVGFTYSL